MESPLLSLGLHPNASLVLMLKKHTNQSGSSNLIQKESMIHSTCHSYDGDRTSNVHSVHNTPQIQQHSWSGGMRLSDNFVSNHQGDGEVDSELQKIDEITSVRVHCFIQFSKQRKRRLCQEIR